MRISVTTLRNSRRVSEIEFQLSLCNAFTLVLKNMFFRTDWFAESIQYKEYDVLQSMNFVQYRKKFLEEENTFQNLFRFFARSVLQTTVELNTTYH